MSSNLFSNLYIQTRGKTIDYRFLLQAPQEPWWTSYEKDTSFEYPTLIIERDSRGGVEVDFILVAFPQAHVAIGLGESSVILLLQSSKGPRSDCFTWLRCFWMSFPNKEVLQL